MRRCVGDVLSFDGGGIQLLKKGWGRGGKKVSPAHVSRDAERFITLLQEVTTTMPLSRSVCPFGELCMVGKYWG